MDIKAEHHSLKVPKHRSTHAPVVPPQKSTTRTKILVAGLIIILLSLLAASGWWVWNQYYNSPEKIVAESIIKSAQALQDRSLTQADVQVQFSGGNARFALSSVNEKSQFGGSVFLTHAGKTQEIKTNVRILSDTELYVQLENLRAVSEAFSQPRDDFGQKVSYFTNLAKKYDGKWIKITKADRASLPSQPANSTQCLQSLKSPSLSDNNQSSVVSSLQQALTGALSEQQSSDKNFKRYQIDVAKLDWSKFENNLPSDVKNCLAQLKSSTDLNITVDIQPSKRELRRIDIRTDVQNSPLQTIITLPSQSEPRPAVAAHVIMPEASVSFTELKSDLEAILGPLQ